MVTGDHALGVAVKAKEFRQELTRVCEPILAQG
jgi:hypothetical protein